MMRAIRRWATSIAASFDYVITQVENHEAIVTSAIKDMQSAGNKARGQLSRVRRDGENMRKRIDDLKELERVWQERAVRVHDKDEAKALECLRRRKQINRELEALETQEKEHTRLANQLSSDLKVIDERVAELKRKKNALSARQYRAEAMRIGQIDDLGLVAEIDDIFERWELKIDEATGFQDSLDDLETDFISEEEEAELRSELDELIAGA
ncbi:MAG: PspA/IM30 family protein [Bdellovibrionales bacterium]|nr:PspA/IM30 family protein [Bdellovibrionales bacterium]